MNEPIDFAELQERHLDTMIRLAFDQEDAEAVQQILEETEPELTPEEQELAERILALTREKAAKQEAAKRKSRPKGTAGRMVMRVLEVAACLIVVFAIATPIAFANSAVFRSKVMQLLVRIDQGNEAAYFTFREDPDAEFFVPEGWMGEYFPSYVPEGMVESWRSENIAAIEYISNGMRGFSFSEQNSGTILQGTENGTVSNVDVQGYTATLYDGMASTGDFRVTSVTWANDTTMFSVYAYDMDVDEVLQIARSVKKVIK
ncbi:MAG: DUF4367 domain-containing protein [Christensenellaceae bacterium]|nr:DUF4367 domain-containing protein [Christensenellaceae bacterium]